MIYSDLYKQKSHCNQAWVQLEFNNWVRKIYRSLALEYLPLYSSINDKRQSISETKKHREQIIKDILE